ncbi:CHAT domain-containing protein [Lewinella sp. W8]|uniref:CHAT domain-containing protein n=1 Tax=Lewinella sp. W8 TaxID=2528208 RepID=UPI00106720D2|nr:CHAT domain-containing protein [Lewinella sp. W8]MTB49751.1 CHAT domain-containing protein [Lewinella sp. W8]
MKKYYDYLYANDYASDSQAYLSTYEELRQTKPNKAAKAFINAMHLWLIYYGHRKVEKYLDQRPDPTGPSRGNIISSLGKAGKWKFEIQLLRAEIAYHQGYNHRCREMLSKLLQEIDRHENKHIGTKNFLLPRIHLLRGKTLNRDRDHALARMDYGLAYNYFFYGKKNQQNGQAPLTLGRIHTAFARSFFDWKQMQEIYDYLEKAELVYKRSFEHQDRKHLCYAELDELRARYVVGMARKNWRKHAKELLHREDKPPIHQTLSWEDKFNEPMADAMRITHHALKGRKNHRRKAHHLRLRARAKLVAAYAVLGMNGRKYIPWVVHRLKQADRLYRREIKMRLKFFNHVPHPTLVRAYNHRGKCLWMLAEAFAQEGKKKEAKKYLQRAEFSLAKAKKINRKPLDVIQRDKREREQSIALQKAASGAMHQVVDRYQCFRTEQREMECKFITLKYPTIFDASPRQVFRAVAAGYHRCEKKISECLTWLTFSESRESLLKEHRSVGELMLEAASLYQPVSQEEEDYRMDRIHRVFMFSQPDVSRSPRFPGKLAEVEPNAQLGPLGKMHILQTASFWRLLHSNEEDLTDEYNEQFFSFANDVSQYHMDQLGEGTGKNPAWRVGSYPSESAVIEHFDGDGGGGVLAIYTGYRHVYAYVLAKTAKGDSHRKFVAITDDEQRRSMDTFISLTADFQNALAKVIESLQDDHNRKLVVEQKTLRYQKTNEHLPDTIIGKQLTPQEADAINSTFLRTGRALAEFLFEKVSIPKSIDRLYLVSNDEHLQRLPLSMLYTGDLPDAGEERDFNHLDFLGLRYQLAIIPSVSWLWRLRKTSTPPDDQVPSADTLNSMLSFLAVRQASSPPDEETKQGVLIFDALKHITQNLNLNYRAIFLPDDLTGMDTIKDHVIQGSPFALIKYFYGHISYEERKYGRKKLILSGKKSAKKEREDRHYGDAFDRNPKHLYLDEIKENDLRNCFLVFLNGCEAAQGDHRIGYLPNSLMSAYLWAGVQAVIGTHVAITSTTAALFGELFMEYWLEEGDTTLGEAIMQTIEDIRRGGMIEGHPRRRLSHRHPIHWGGYTLMGDLTLKWSDVKALLNPGQ